MSAVKPRVLILAQEVHPIPPIKGAAVEQWIDAVAHRYSRYEPHIVSVPHPSRDDDEVEAGVHYHRIRVGRVYTRLFRKITRLDPYSYLRRALRYAKSISPALFHIHNAPQFADGIKAGAGGARVILHMHNEKTDSITAELDAMVGCSEYISDWYRARGVKAGRYATLPNGVDTKRYVPATKNEAIAARARLQIPIEKSVILFVGRISPEKGPDLLARMGRYLDPSRFHLVFVGEWPAGDSKSSERVRYAERFKSELDGLPYTVVGSIEPTRMHEIYRIADILVVPSKFNEPFSMAAIEAMACGIPVLALRKGGMQEYMVNGENAVLVDPEVSPEALAGQITRLSHNMLPAQAMNDNARAMVVERFDWTAVARTTEALYDEVLAARVRA